MRPDPNSDEAGAESEYGNDTGFAAEATRVDTPETDTGDETPTNTAAGPGDGGD
jgi:hypothetical protein